MWFREHVAIFMWEDDRGVIDTIEDPICSSPDGLYAMVIPDEDEVGTIVRHLLDRLYYTDIDFARHFLEAVRWETSSTLTETAYEHRESRLGDIGFVPFHEALEVYAFLDPRPWASRARTRADDPNAELLTFDVGTLPPVDHQLQILEERRFSEGSSYFTRALASMPQAFTDEETLRSLAASVMSQFRALVNRVHIADMGNPGDVEAATQAAGHVDDYVGIGLEMAASASSVVAARVLATTPLKEAFRAGYSTTMTLQAQAQRLVQRGNLTLTDAPASLLTDDDAELLEGLMRPRPAMDGAGLRPFRSLVDVEHAARRLGHIAFLELLFFGMLKHSKAELAQVLFDATRNATPIDLVSFRSLFATCMAHHRLGTDHTVEPLSEGEVERFFTALASADDALGMLVDTGIALIEARRPEGANISMLSRVFSTEVAGWLIDELGGVERVPPREIQYQLVLVRP